MRKVYSLNQNWLFDKVINTKEESLHKIEKGENINLPHTWNIGENIERNLYVYEKNIEILEKHKNDDLFLEFLGANSVCRVYLNDFYLGEHRGGYSTFRFKITNSYNWNGDNKLKVYVDNSLTTDVSPLTGDFTIYGGLYRSVNLICVNKVHFDLEYFGSPGIIVRTKVSENLGNLDLEIHSNADLSILSRYEIYNESEELVYKIEKSGIDKKINIDLESPKLWDAKNNPYLYKLKASLLEENSVLDEVSINFGFRKCELFPDKGFFLNNKHFFINGIAKHQDFEGVGNAINTSNIEKDFELIEEIGANSVRLSHYQHDQSVYDMCDKNGLVVWAEIPMLALPDNTDGVLLNASNQLKELILQNIHHPSICFWGIQNEIAMGGESLSMYKSIEELNNIAKELIPGEIICCANMHYVKNNSHLNFITEMLGYNLYYGWYYGEMKDLDEWITKFHKENPKIPLGISEYGADCNLAFHSSVPKVKDYSEEFQSKYHEETYSIIKSKDYLWGSYVWNMFDFGSSIRNEGGVKGKNCKGLVTFDRKVKKDSFYFYKANWSKSPFIHICEKRFINRAEEKIDIKIYSNLNNISLSVNDEHVKTLKGNEIFLFKDVKLKNGENKIVTYSENIKDETIFIKVNKLDESYVFIDPNPEINVKNWFTQREGEIDLFPENSYSILDSLGTLMMSEEAWNVVKERAPKIAERALPGDSVTLLWVFNKMRKFSEEEIKKINLLLTKIKKNN